MACCARAIGSEVMEVETRALSSASAVLVELARRRVPARKGQQNILRINLSSQPHAKLQRSTRL